MDLKKLNRNIQIGENVTVRSRNINLGQNVRIGNNVKIHVEDLDIHDGVTIEDEVQIYAKIFKAGYGAKIQSGCSIASYKKSAVYISVGEQTTIAHDSKVFVPVVAIGDYGSIENHTLMNGRQPIIIGHNCWIGQNCILNSNEDLIIGNNVGIGAYSSIYTHGFFGDLLEGCQVFKEAPVVIEDDVWILGSYNVISPGVRIGEKALILTGSNVTKDVRPNHTIAGSPGKDITDRFIPYRPVSAKEKLTKIRTFIKEFFQGEFPNLYQEEESGFYVNCSGMNFRILLTPEIDDQENLPADRPLLVFAQVNKITKPMDGVTVFDLSERTYLRCRSDAEIKVINFLKSYRARFVPADNPRVILPGHLQ